MPPFPQLGRPVYDIEPGDHAERLLKRFGGRRIGAATLVRTLENLGWLRGNAYDNGVFMLHTKPFPALGMTAVVQYDGVGMGMIAEEEDQSIDEVYVLAGIQSADDLGWGVHEHRGPSPMTWGEVDAIIRSEVLADVNTILAKAR